jgi:hypothetical protein
MHNECLHNFYSSQTITRMIKSRRMFGVMCSMYGEMRNAYKILVTNSEGKRPRSKAYSYIGG